MASEHLGGPNDMKSCNSNFFCTGALRVQGLIRYGGVNQFENGVQFPGSGKT